VVGSVAELLRRTVDFSPEQVRFLQYGRVADTTATCEQLGFSPKWSSLQAFEDFAASRLRKLVTQEQVTRVEREALATLRRAAGFLGGAR
jgi:UDP-glucose 4-epimerase